MYHVFNKDIINNPKIPKKSTHQEMHSRHCRGQDQDPSSVHWCLHADCALQGPCPRCWTGTRDAVAQDSQRQGVQPAVASRGR